MSGPGLSPNPTPQTQPQQKPAKAPAAAPSPAPAVIPAAPPPPAGPPAGGPRGPVNQMLNPLASMYSDKGSGAGAGTPKPTGAGAAPTAAPTSAVTQTPTTTPGQQTTPVADPKKDPAAAAPPAKTIKPEEIAQAAADIRKQTDGHWFASPASTLQILRGRSPEEIDLIKKEYQDHYGVSLDSALGGRLKGKDKAEFDALNAAKAGDPGSQAAAIVAGLQNAEKNNFLHIGGTHADKEAVDKILNGVTDPKVREEVAKRMNLDGYIDKLYSGDEKAKVKAEASGDPAKKAAAELSMATHTGLFGGGTDNQKILDKLAECKTPEQRDALAKAYKDISGGKDLNTLVDTKLKKEDKQAAKALLDGHPELAAAYQIEAASQKHGMFSFIGIGGPDKERLNKQFEGKSDKEREAIQTAFNQTYGNGNANTLQNKLSSTLKGDDLDKAKQLVKDGQVSDELTLKMSMNTGLFGMFTDDKAVNKVLAGKSKDEIDKLKKSYSDLYHKDLEAELTSRTGGDAGFEVRENLKGKPTTPEEMVERANERYQHQRSGGVRKFFVDTFGGEAGKDLDRQNQKLNSTYNQYEADKRDGKGTQEHETELSKISNWHDLDVKNCQERTDAIANTAGTVASVTAGAVLTVATAGAASPLLAAAIVAGGSGAAMMATKAVVKGGGYGGDELKNDLVDTGFNMATAVATAGVGKFMQGPKVDSMLRNVAGIDPTKAATSLNKLEKLKLGVLSKTMEGGPSGVATAATDRKNWEGGPEAMFKGILKDGSLGMLKNGFGALKSGATDMVWDGAFMKQHPELARLEMLKKIPGFGNPAANDVDKGFLGSLGTGAKNGLVTAGKNYGMDVVSSTLTDANTWSQGNFLNSLGEHAEQSWNTGKPAKDVLGGVKDGAMSSRFVENKMRSLAGVEQVKEGTKPSEWGNSVTNQDDKYRLARYRGLTGGTLTGVIDTVTDPNAGDHGWGDAAKHMLDGVGKGVSSSVSAEAKAADAATDKKKLESMRRLARTYAEQGVDPSDEKLPEDKRNMAQRLQKQFGAPEQIRESLAAEQAEKKTAADADAQERLAARKKKQEEYEQRQAAKRERAAMRDTERNIKEERTPGSDRFQGHTMFPDAPAGMNDQDVMDLYSR